MSTFSIRLSEDIEKRLENLAVQTARTKAFYVKQAILNLEDLEDYFMAEKASEDFRARGEKAIPLEEVMREYGPWKTGISPSAKRNIDKLDIQISAAS